MSVCEEWLEENGQCDIQEAGHDLPHVLINIDHGITWKVTWPHGDDDPDVARYKEHGDALVAADDLEIERRAARA